MTRPSRLIAASVLAVALATTGVACSSDSSTTTSSGGTAAPGTSAAAAAVTVTDPWARTSPASAANGAVYLTLESNAGDVLTGVSVPTSVAGKAEIHETVMGGTTGTSMAEDEMDGGMDDATESTMMDGATGSTMMEGNGTPGTMAGAGEMSMRPIDSLELPAGVAVELKPGGYHIMLIGLVEPLKAGDTVSVTLTFEKAGEQTVSAVVRDA